MITRLPQGRLDSETTFNVGTVEGGSVRNAGAGKRDRGWEFRSLNLEAIDDIHQQIDGVLDKVRGMFPEATIDADT